MPGTGELALTLLTVAILLASGAWTERRFRRFDQLPAHYDFSGKATRYSPRRTMAWLLPVTFSVLMVVIVFAISAIPDKYRDGSTLSATILCSTALLGAQGTMLWLHARWARKQD